MTKLQKWIFTNNRNRIHRFVLIIENSLTRGDCKLSRHYKTRTKNLRRYECKQILYRSYKSTTQLLMNCLNSEIIRNPIRKQQGFVTEWDHNTMKLLSLFNILINERWWLNQNKYRLTFPSSNKLIIIKNFEKSWWVFFADKRTRKRKRFKTSGFCVT